MLREICDLGFDSVELGYALTRAQAEGVREWEDAGHVEVSSVHAFCPGSIDGKTGPELFSITNQSDKDGTKRGIQAVKETGEFAYSVGAKAVVLHAGRVAIRRHVKKLEKIADKGLLDTPKHTRVMERMMAARDRRVKDNLDTLCESLNELLPYFEKLGIALGLENLPTYDGIPNEPEMQILLDSFPSPSFGCWHDSGHAQVRHNLGLTHHAGIVSRFSDRIVGLHLHDVVRATSDHHMPPVEGGTVNFKIFSPLLVKDIPFVLEPSRGTDETSVKRAAEFLCRLWELGGAGDDDDKTI